MTPEQQRIIDSKPIWRMRRFAALFNWHGLELNHHILSAEKIERLNFHPSGTHSFRRHTVNRNVRYSDHLLSPSLLCARTRTRPGWQPPNRETK